MRIITAISVSVVLALTACGQAAAPGAADAQTAGAAANSSEVSDAEKTAILTALQMQADAQGQVLNECGDMVTPQFLVADLGAGPGRVVAFVIGGGPSSASCYGDGPLVVLYRNADGAWREIYQNRGGGVIILPTQHNNANDLADGGPGFSFPVWEWNGSAYADANRSVADSALGDARFLPN
jgi:hypothetical protein